LIELSLYLARAWGLFSVLVSLGLLINRENYRHMVTTLKSDDISVLIAGVFALVMGVVQVVGYNSWTLDYRGLITLLGWVALLKGIAILFVPGYMERFARAVAWGTWYLAALVVFLVLGAYLLYVGITG
jgi:hypothetical protein